MGEKGMIFGAESVRAILSGTKTMTRRVVKNAENDYEFVEFDLNPAMTAIDKHGGEYPKTVKGLWATFRCDGNPEFPMIKSEYKVGDIVYVKEAWCHENSQYKKHTGYRYCSTCGWNENGKCANDELPYWFEGKKSPWFMPKAAARIWLRITGVRVERLQEITPEDCRAEGIKKQYYYNIINGKAEIGKLNDMYMRKDFEHLWGKINGKKGCSWEDNPFVFVYTFERIGEPRAD